MCFQTISVTLGNRCRTRPTWRDGRLVDLYVEIDESLRPSWRGEALAHELIHVCQFLSGAIRPGARFAREGSDESWAYNGSERWYLRWQEYFDRGVRELWRSGGTTFSITTLLKNTFEHEWDILFLDEHGPLTW